MSRILLACLLLLGLSLASCSSASSADELGVDPSIDTSHHDPRPGGLSNGFHRYWLGDKDHSPYASEESERGFLSIFFGTGDSFGDTTTRKWRPAPELYPQPGSHKTLHKLVLNEDFDDPYTE